MLTGREKERGEGGWREGGREEGGGGRETVKITSLFTIDFFFL